MFSVFQHGGGTLRDFLKAYLVLSLSSLVSLLLPLNIPTPLSRDKANLPMTLMPSVLSDFTFAFCN